MELQIKDHTQEANQQHGDDQEQSKNQQFGKKSSQELNLIDSFNMSSTSSTNNTLGTHKGSESEPRVFSCNYCQRKFYSSQALGGHQNAHKRERNLAKRGQIIGASMMAAAATFGHGHSYNFSSMASLPLNNSYNSRSLGIQVHSMVHKPSFTPSNWSKNFYARDQDLSRLNINQKTSFAKLAMENVHGSYGRLDTVRVGVSSLRDDGISGCWPRGSSGHVNSNQDEFTKLDLSLKL